MRAKMACLNYFDNKQIVSLFFDFLKQSKYSKLYSMDFVKALSKKFFLKFIDTINKWIENLALDLIVIFLKSGTTFR